MTQNEIADRMYTSRSKISRMLKEARELGIVEISIKEPWERDLNLEKEIQQTYGVKTVRAVSSRDISMLCCSTLQTTAHPLQTESLCPSKIFPFWK